MVATTTPKTVAIMPANSSVVDRTTSPQRKVLYPFRFADGSRSVTERRLVVDASLGTSKESVST
eukprot:2585643-Pleurochrysis_carterae.AAC.1